METKAAPKKRTVSRCPECGKRKSKHSNFCRKCSDAQHEASCARAQAIVDTKVCPHCGSPLARNATIIGWWQCAQYGSRVKGNDPSKPRCGFQCFTY